MNLLPILGRWRNQLSLATRLARREIDQRFRQTTFGGLWTLINPLLLLLIYWYVFSEVFGSRWSGPAADRHYALILFSGLVMFNLWAEIVNGSTTLVKNNALLIKRTTVGPKVLPISMTIAALFTFVLSLVPLLLMYLVLERQLPPWKAIFLPLIIGPLLLLSLGVAFILASFSAYFRDLQQVIPLLNTAILFLSPIFFPLDRLPEGVQRISQKISPLVEPLEASRQLVFEGVIPSIQPLAIYSVVAAAICLVGWVLYGKAARGFADVV